MKAEALREKTDQDLQQELLALLREKFNLRMQQGSGQAVKSHRFAEIRKIIAQIKTILHERKQS